MIELDVIDYDKKEITVKLEGKDLCLEVVSLASQKGALAFNRFLKYTTKIENSGEKLFDDVVVLGEVVDVEPTEHYHKANAWLSAQLVSGFPEGFDLDAELESNYPLTNMIFNAAQDLANEFKAKKKL